MHNLPESNRTLYENKLHVFRHNIFPPPPREQKHNIHLAPHPNVNVTLSHSPHARQAGPSFSEGVLALKLRRVALVGPLPLD